MLLSKKVFVTVLALFLFSSCLEKYDLDFDLTGKNLTLNSEIEINEKIKALVTLTKSPLDYDNYFTPPNAEVVLYENDELFDILKYQSKNGQLGIYTTDKRAATPNNKYTFKVRYKDLPELTATQTTFDSPVIEHINIDKDVRSISDSGNVTVQINIAKNKKDKRYFGIINFFEINFLNEDGEIATSWETVDMKMDNTFRDVNNYQCFESDHSQQISYDLNFQNLQKFQSDSIRAVWFYIEVKEFSEDAYLYRKTYRYKGSDNYGEPTLVHSNIKNGFGIFGTSSRSMKVFPVKGFR